MKFILFILSIWIISSFDYVREASIFNKEDLQTSWVGNSMLDLEFSGTKVKSARFDFLDTFCISGDTLCFHHDYKTKDLVKWNPKLSKDEITKYHLEDSRFLIISLDSFNLELQALNLSAILMAEQIGTEKKSFSFRDTFGEKNADEIYDIRYSIDVIKLRSKKSLYEKLVFNEIQFSSKNNQAYSFRDIHIFSDGSYVNATLFKETQGKRKYRKNFDRLSKGQLSQKDINELNEILSRSGLYKSPFSLSDFGITSSHSSQISLKIECENKKSKFFETNSADFSLELTNFIYKLRSCIKYDPIKRRKSTPCFSLSYRKNFKEACK